MKNKFHCVFFMVSCSLSFDEMLSSAYELYADLLQPKDKLWNDNSLPKDESLNTEDLQKGKSSQKEDKDSPKINDNSGKQEEGSRKKEDKPQENDPALPKEDSSKSKKGLGKHWTKSQEKAGESSEMAKHFKKMFLRPGIKVHFIGVWCIPTVIVILGFLTTFDTGIPSLPLV
jgi:hypothetical protein